MQNRDFFLWGDSINHQEHPATRQGDQTQDLTDDVTVLHTEPLSSSEVKSKWNESKVRRLYVFYLFFVKSDVDFVFLDIFHH